MSFYFLFTSGFLAVEIRIKTLAAHLGDLLHLAVCHVLQQPSQVCPRVHRLQLFFIQVQHLVDAPFVLELRIKNGIVVAWPPFDHRGHHHRWKHLTSFPVSPVTFVKRGIRKFEIRSFVELFLFQDFKRKKKKKEKQYISDSHRIRI